MNENRKRGTSNNKILTAIAIASLFIGSSKIMAIETYSENSFGVTEQMQAQTARGIIVDQNGEPIIGAIIIFRRLPKRNLSLSVRRTSLTIWTRKSKISMLRIPTLQR